MKRFRYLTIAIFATLAFTGCSSRGDNLSNNAGGALDGYGAGYNSDYNDGMYSNGNTTDGLYGSSNYGGYGTGTDGYGYNSGSYNYSGNPSGYTGIIYDGADGFSGNYNGGTTGYGTVYNSANGMPYTSTTANQK